MLGSDKQATSRERLSFAQVEPTLAGTVITVVAVQTVVAFIVMTLRQA